MSYNLSILRIVTGRLRNVEIHPFALSDTTGTSRLNIPVKKQGKIGPGLAHFGEESDRNFIVQPVETARLDDVAGKCGLSRVDFIKIDVEGAELPAFKGAESIISQYRPVIFAEVEGKFTQRIGYHPEELFAYLAQFGYSADLLTPRGKGFLLSPVNHYEQAGDYLFRSHTG
jgi:FkbM family methyltransferase